ncbi:hypothetical protein ISCGN_025164 [Ixodes scapularis]
MAQRELQGIKIPHMFVELIPRSGQRLFVLNVYSKPSMQHRFGELFRKARAVAGDGPLLIAGDFNAPHAAWGYGRETLKGKRLNMHPTDHVGRRNRRASDLQRRFCNSDKAVYVDAARYGERRRAHAIAVVNRTGNCIASATVRTRYTEAAEEAAIALALVAAPDAAVVISDSQAAVRGFARGRVSREAARILQTRYGGGDRGEPRETTSSTSSPSHTQTENAMVFLLWTPAHAGVPLAGNEAAHAAARGLTRRAAADTVAASVPESGAVATAGEDVTTDEQEQQPEWSWGDRLTTFRDITQHHRLNRRKYPPPHDKLNKAEAVIWRLLQTHTYPSPATLRHCYPSLYLTDACKTCGNRATLRHMLWECAGTKSITATAHVAADVSQGGNSSSIVAAPAPGPGAAAAAVAAAGPLRRRRRRWEEALASDDLADQLWAVRQAEDAARVQGLRAVT